MKFEARIDGEGRLRLFIDGQTEEGTAEYIRKHVDMFGDEPAVPDAPNKRKQD